MKQLFILIVCLAGTLLLTVLMRDQGKPLLTCNTPGGILNLEFAATPAAAKLVLQEWQQQGACGVTGIDTALANTRLDFAYILFYSLFFYMTSLILGQTLPGMAGNTGRLLKWAAVLAGLLDAAENILMLNTLAGSISASSTFCTALFAKLKFGLLAACLLYLLAGLLWLLFSRKAKVVVH